MAPMAALVAPAILHCLCLWKDDESKALIIGSSNVNRVAPYIMNVPGIDIEAMPGCKIRDVSRRMKEIDEPSMADLH